MLHHISRHYIKILNLKLQNHQNKHNAFGSLPSEMGLMVLKFENQYLDVLSANMVQHCWKLLQRGFNRKFKISPEFVTINFRKTQLWLEISTTARQNLDFCHQIEHCGHDFIYWFPKIMPLKSTERNGVDGFENWNSISWCSVCKYGAALLKTTSERIQQKIQNIPRNRDNQF